MDTAHPLRPGPAVVAAVSAGGVIGALLRHLMETVLPVGPGFNWAIFVVNAIGSAAMGVLVAVVAAFWPTQQLIRPFFGTGVLGGFTTFSTYAFDGVRLIHTAPLTATAYLISTPVLALLAVWVAAGTTTRLAGRRTG